MPMSLQGIVGVIYLPLEEVDLDEPCKKASTWPKSSNDKRLR